MDARKSKWLTEHVRCPACGADAFVFADSEAVCRQCQKRYASSDGVIDFLDDQALTAFNIVSTDNVSDHPYDYNARAIIDKCAEVGAWVLDCGSGYKSDTFPNVVQMEVARFANVDLLAVNQRLPFVDDCFDAIFSLDVLEHVSDPFGSAAEIVRVLKPGGVLYLDLPFLQAEHGYPHHYFNATRMGARQLFADLDVLSHHVPRAGHPIFGLHHSLMVYLDGLPVEQRGRFADMKIGELLGKPPLEWLDDPLITELRADSRWVLASTTQALLKKATDGRRDTRALIVPQDLPEFPDYVPAPPPAEGHGPRRSWRDRFGRQRVERSEP